jgi:hypothetical protein
VVASTDGATLMSARKLGFVLQVDVAAPTEQDQRDIEVRAVLARRMSGRTSCTKRRFWKKALPFQMRSMTAVIRTVSTRRRGGHLRALERVALVTRIPPTQRIPITLLTLNKLPSNTEESLSAKSAGIQTRHFAKCQV